MKKLVIALLALLVVIGTAIGTYAYTMTHLEIQTDGDGDSAFVTCLGQEWFYGINGCVIDADGTMCEAVIE